MIKQYALKIQVYHYI